jgi:hypothetical protein
MFSQEVATRVMRCMTRTSIAWSRGLAKSTSLLNGPTGARSPPYASGFHNRRVGA